MKMWTRAEGTAAGEEDEGGREKCVSMGGVQKLDVASLLHLTPSTSDLLDITECIYRKASNDQHPIQLLTNTSQSLFTTLKMC